MEVKYEKQQEQEQLQLLARKSYIHLYIFLSFLLNKYIYYNYNYIDYSKADFAVLCNYLLDIDYSVCLQSDSIEYVWSYLKNAILSGKEMFIPKKLVKHIDTIQKFVTL